MILVAKKNGTINVNYKENGPQSDVNHNYCYSRIFIMPLWISSMWEKYGNKSKGLVKSTHF